MYTGSYHRAARRAADTVAASAPGTRVMILSAMYGLVDLDEPILRYDLRLGHRLAITAQGLYEQAEQLGLLGTNEVVVLAPTAYADLAIQVWPHARRPLAGTRGIGEQMARLKALAVGEVAAAAPLASSDDPPATGTAATGRPACSDRSQPGLRGKSATNPRPHSTPPAPTRAEPGRRRCIRSRRTLPPARPAANPHRLAPTRPARPHSRSRGPPASPPPTPPKPKFLRSPRCAPADRTPAGFDTAWAAEPRMPGRLPLR